MTAGVLVRAGTVKRVNRDPQMSQVNAWMSQVTSITTSFVDWLHVNGMTPAANGVLEEFGWPNNGTQTAAGEAAIWDVFGDTFLDWADSLGFPRLAWGAGRGWGAYNMGCYTNPSTGGVADISVVQSNALVYERHLGDPRSGVCLSGGENRSGSSSGNPAAGGLFSNINLGVYGTDYYYPSLGDFQFLASRGIGLARVMVKWERLQPTMSGALDSTEVGRIATVLTNARAAGVQVVLCPWNGIGYTTSADATINTAQFNKWSLLTTPEPLGGGHEAGVLYPAIFADFWRRMATAFQGYPGLFAYSLVNEPGVNDEFGTLGTNLCIHGGMEDGVGWAAPSGGTFSFSTTNPHSGSTCAQVVADGTGLVKLQESGNGTIGSMPVSASTQYQASIWVSAAPTQWSMQVSWLDSSYSYIGQSIPASFPVSSSGQWVQILGGVTSPAGAAHAQIVAVSEKTLASGTVCYFDDAMLMTGTYNTQSQIIVGHTQAALAAIRAVDMVHEIWVPALGQSSLHWGDVMGPPWITDPANKFRYAVHQYFDTLLYGEGVYVNTYAAENAYAVANGYGAYTGTV